MSLKTQNGSLVTNYDRRLLALLLTPSWLSGLLAIIGGLFVVGGVVAITRFEGSSLKQQFLGIHGSIQGSSPNGEYLAVQDSIFSNTVLSALPLLIFWGCAGLIVYLFASNVIKAFNEAVDLKQELDYVHNNRHKRIREAVIHLLIRLLVLGVWIPFIILSFHVLLPYSITSASAGANGLLSPSNLVDIALAFIVISLTLQAHAIFLRLLLLRPRVFSDALYTD